MVAFYNEADNLLYKQPNSQFITQDRFRGDVAPNPEEIEEVTETFGIPATTVFQNSGGGNGGGGVGNYGLPGDFQQVVNARQNKLNKPIDTSTFMGKAKDFMNPQSAKQIMDDGYQEPRFQPGIIGTIMGKFDNYRNLPQADQAFISQNMGYTGPTVFGDNNSGLSKDPYGINTRSLGLFGGGNYADYVDKTAYGLEQALEDAEEKYGGKTKRYYDMTKLMREKLNFYRGKKKESEELRMREELAAEEYARDIQNIQGRVDRSETDINKATEQGRAINSNEGVGTVNPSSNYGKSQGYTGGTHNPHTQSGWSGSTKKAKGGRVGYFFGGLAARGMKR